MLRGLRVVKTVARASKVTRPSSTSVVAAKPMNVVQQRFMADNIKDRESAFENKQVRDHDEILLAKLRDAIRKKAEAEQELLDAENEVEALHDILHQQAQEKPAKAEKKGKKQQ